MWATPSVLRVRLDGEYREADGVARVTALLASDQGFCLLTCFRSDQPFHDNASAFLCMPGQLQGLTARPDAGGFWLVAHWVELAMPAHQADKDQHGPGEGSTAWMHSVEYAWFFVQPPDLADDEWRLAAMLVAKAHGQSAFILRAGGAEVARLHGRDGTPWAALPSADAVIATARVLTLLRSRAGAWGRADYDWLAADGPGTGTALTGPSRFAVHPAAAAPTGAGPDDVTVYAAVPHCNSARMLFAHLRIRHGG